MNLVARSRRRPFKTAATTAVSLGLLAVLSGWAGGVGVSPADAQVRKWALGSAQSLQRASSVPAQPFVEANQLAGQRIWLNTETQASAARRTPGAVGAAASMIASVPTAVWVGNGFTTATMASRVSTILASAAQTHTVPVFVTYDMVHRDCGSYSAGGAPDAASYRTWIDAFVRALGSAQAVVIEEPDALASMDCLSLADQSERLGLLKYATTALTANHNLSVYLDAGTSRWHPADVTASRLAAAGVSMARGFSLNISNFFATDVTEAYGEAVSALLGGAHYVIDTSRNGNGAAPKSALSSCNPPGRALGARPTTSTTAAHDDAWLWIKLPGESDGNCRPGEPAAGKWYGQYAYDLAHNAGWL